MKALVTGATGFIGSNLVKRLEKEGWQIKLLLRPESNLLDIGSLKKAVSGIDVIFHLAAALPHHHLKDQEYWNTNVQGTKNLLQVCKSKKIKRFVHVSTVGIYDKPPSPYSKTKKEAEKAVISFYQKNKLPTTIIRPTIAYGPGDTRPGFLNLFRLIERGLFLPIGKGDNFFHTIFIDNLLDSLLLAATKKNAIGEDFIIGDDPCPTMKEILKEIFRISKKSYPNFYIPIILAYSIAFIFDLFRKVGLPAFLPSQRVKFMTEDRKYDISKAVKMLNWRPKIGLTEGLQKTYQWYKKEGLV